MSLRDTIKSSKRRLEPVDVPGWGTVFVRALSARERLEWEELPSKTAAEKAHATAVMVRMAACDADGFPVFTDDDLEWLAGDADSPDLYAVFKKATEVNALTEKSAGDIRKNSEAAANGAAASPTNSPATSAALT